MDCRIGIELKRELDELFEKALMANVTPGAVVAVSIVRLQSERKNFVFNYGYTSIFTGRERVKETTFFDLASLTKPLVTVLCLLNLVQQRLIDSQSTLVELLPLVEVPEDKKEIRLWHLMSHCSGLPAYRPYFVEALGLKKSARKNYFLQSILAEQLEYKPGRRHIYSDLGYILLGEIIEQLTRKRLDVFFKETLVESLGLWDKLYFPSNRGIIEPLSCAVTEICPWTNTLLKGIVHDDNCRVLGGVAGHAGLFGTAGAVLDVCSKLCQIWQGGGTTDLFSTEILHSFLTKRDGSTWTCGFDTPSALSSSSGNLFSASSVGHLGFTGTSLWIDLERGISVVLLTNRVHPSRKNQNHKKLRPAVHNIIMRKLVAIDL